MKEEEEKEGEEGEEKEKEEDANQLIPDAFKEEKPVEVKKKIGGLDRTIDQPIQVVVKLIEMDEKLYVYRSSVIS